MRVRFDILTEHAEEIEILWSRRRTALWSPRETLDTLAALERRLDAHLAGLALDVDCEHECFERGLAGDDPDAAFTSAATLLRQQSLSSIERVFGAFGSASPGARAGIAEALAYAPLAPLAEQRLEDLAAAESGGSHSRLAIRALAAHGLRPLKAGPALAQARAACAAARHGDGEMLFALGSLGAAEDVPALARAAARPQVAPHAIRALGSLGLAAAVEPLLDLMHDDSTAPAAGEAFWRITGLEVVSREDAPPADGDEHFEEILPWPDAARTRELWRQRASVFSDGLRWRRGKPLDCRRWLGEPHAGDLLTRREEISRLRAEVPGALANLDVDAPAARQRLWAP